LSMVLCSLTTGFVLAQQPQEPNTTVFIYQDDNNNGAKDDAEPYLDGFSLEVTGFNNQNIEFEEVDVGVFTGYIPRRARIVVNGYTDENKEGNVGTQSQASVFFAEPGNENVSY